MCLDKIRPDMNRFEKGWKYLVCFNGELFPPIKGLHKPLPENKWIHYKKWSCKEGKISTLMGDCYPQGWHVEATLKGAMGWLKGYFSRDRHRVVRQVLCRDMHTVGRQRESKVGVCRYIKILPEGSKS